MATKNPSRQTAASRKEAQPKPAKLSDILAKNRDRRVPIKNAWDVDLFLRNIPGPKGFLLMAKLEALPTDEKGQIDVNEKSLATMIEFASVVLVNSEGQAILDSDQGRAAIAELLASEQMELFKQITDAMRITDKEPEKNEPSPSGDSVSP